MVKKVLLPAPEGPMINTTSPKFALKFTLLSAVTSAAPLPYTF